MWLLDKMLRKLVQKGELTVIDHDGKEYRYGAPDPNHGPIRVRLTDTSAAWHIAKDPRVGAGEAYMDGWLVVEPPHDIRDLVLLIRYNAPFEKPGALKPKGPITRSAQLRHRQARPDQLEEPLAPQCRAHLQSDPAALRALPRRGPAIYLRLLPQPDRQPRAGAARQEGAYRRQAQPEARHEGARHRLRLGRARALSPPPLRRRRARRRAGARPDRVLQRARRGSSASPTG